MTNEIPVADENGGIRYITAYTSENPPADGDVVWGILGPDVRIISRYIIPKDGDEGTVIP